MTRQQPNNRGKPMEENKEGMADKAAGFAGQAAEKASQFAGQAKEMMSKVDVNKATGVADAFMNKVFFFGKLFSALVMLGCCVVMVGSLVYYVFARGDSLEVPEFSGETNAQTVDWNAGSKAGVKEKNAVRSKYESKILKLIEIARLDHDDFEQYVDTLSDYDKEYRSAFINGALDYVKSVKKWEQKKNIPQPSSGNYERTVKAYQRLFDGAVDDVKGSREDAVARKKTALGICGSTCLGLVLFLMLPLLIKIEENTRK